MKTLQYYMYGILFCVLSMGMGFPDIILEKELPKKIKHTAVKKVAATAANTATKETMDCTRATKPVKSRQSQSKPAQAAACPGIAADSFREMYLKLFDKEGNLLLIENINVEEFLSKNYPLQNLPAGSKFVMFHGNTAYYYIETAI